jgi:hypothetical protein
MRAGQDRIMVVVLRTAPGRWYAGGNVLRDRRMRRVVAWTLFFMLPWASARGVSIAGPPYRTIADAFPDAAPRPTDPSGSAAYDFAAHRLPDLEQIVIGEWAPDDPENDLFTGTYSNGGAFLRLELVLMHLMNPPGSVDPGYFDPFCYGPHPVYGFVEIDMDNDIETGGELDAPEYRYLGNIARFGGKPAGDVFDQRVAESASAFDQNFNTPPYVDRGGEEFHLALLGGQFSWNDVTVVAGDADAEFETGETWQIEGDWLHRAHGYEPFSLAEGGAIPGEYDPQCTLRFRHDPAEDRTHVTLVVPLTNVAAGLMRDEPPEALNGDPSDQASILEGLVDLHDSATFLDIFPTGLPEESIITEWLDKSPQAFLAPADWRITALLGSSYTVANPTGAFFIWSDANPDIIRGDMNGDGEADINDRTLVDDFIVEQDGLDGTVDGQAQVAGFPSDFRVFDTNQDGAVASLDVALVCAPGDTDDDGDQDLADFARLQACRSSVNMGEGSPACGLLDFDADADVDADDVQRFLQVLSGPS